MNCTESDLSLAVHNSVTGKGRVLPRAETVAWLSVNPAINRSLTAKWGKVCLASLTE